MLEFWIKKYVEKAKSNVIYDPVIQKFNSTLTTLQYVLQFTMSITDFMLYSKFVVILMHLLTLVQSFDDVLMSAPMIATLISLVVVVMSTNLM